MKSRRSGFVVCCAVGLIACSSPGTQWSKATAANTIAAYQEFLSKYPNDARAAEAKSRIAHLEDESAWNTAQIASSVDGYRQYLSVEPNGEHAQAALEEIQFRDRAAAWQAVESKETADSLQGFMQKYPSGDEADRARDKLKQLAGYRVELGTAHTQQAADHKRQELARRFARDLPSVVVLEPDATSRDFRITSAPMSERDANAACASLTHARQVCKVIQSAS
jgi:outer membrane protein assembly factor BamD (BamD/ComL family)